MSFLKDETARLWQAARSLYRTVVSLDAQGALVDAVEREALAIVAHLAEALAATEYDAGPQHLEAARSAALALLGLLSLWEDEPPPATWLTVKEQARRLVRQLDDALAHPESFAGHGHALFVAEPATLPAKEALPVSLDLLQPNSRHCFVCGVENPCGLQMRFFQTGPGEVTAYYRAPLCFQGYPGVVHGGIQASMLDEALGRAVMGTDPDSARLFYTARMTITYRQHVPVEQTLRIVGRVLKDRGRAVRSWAAIYNEADELLTEAEGLLLAVPEEEARQMDTEALGWQVYPLKIEG
ncbi:MAG TPA: PaaI family thioesterase [Anaerolineae bacterium]|nr:PaaI family thioesterase [Anaerolineae bacterium]HID84407.1 PaaI family thioesterase [Anaerolineales bacterium]HIQ09743.1 PaaI family thioesterase [Anaerolineaceae bacterium]